MSKMFRGYVVTDVQNHRLVHYEINDYSHLSKAQINLRTTLKEFWFRLRYEADRYDVQSSSCNSEEAFYNNNPGLERLRS